MPSPFLVEIAREKTDRTLASVAWRPTPPRLRDPAIGYRLPALAAIADLASFRRPARRPATLRGLAYRT